MLVVLQSLDAQGGIHVLGAPEETLSARIQVACSKYKTKWLLNCTRILVNLKAPVLSRVSSKQARSSRNNLLKARPVPYHGTVLTILLPVDTTANLIRLHSPSLPDKQRIMILVEEYFAHVHPLRCFGFVHKPSFMQRLDEDLDSCCNNESLLHIICALGAKSAFNPIANYWVFSNNF